MFYSDILLSCSFAPSLAGMKSYKVRSIKDAYTVEPLYNGHLWGTTFCPLERGVPNSWSSGIFPVGVVLRNPAVEYNVAAFSELSFAARWQGRLSRG